MTTEPVVFVVDDDASVRDSIRVLLKANGLASEGYASAESFLQGYQAPRPGCLILDIRLGGMDGLELQRRLGAMGCQLPIIFLTGHGDVRTAVKTMQIGAVSFIEKPFDEYVLLNEVRGAIQMDTEARKVDARCSTARALLDSLTARESEVMRLVAMGMSNKRIAVQLGISTRTVEVHRARVMLKLGGRTPAHLVRTMAAAGVSVDPPSPVGHARE